MKIVYVGDEASVVVGDGVVFAKGETVDIDGDLARSLLEQGTFARPPRQKHDKDDADVAESAVNETES